ncbi:GNAT family N-acetyltransferase [Terrabacter sp. Soil811]|uniref:GNAT family N-acetyltransferase n=1 Tax=Terrabacter sp. Soil811 TaxID=1736419 RepID=UPI003FCE0806
MPGAVGVFGIATPPEHRRRGLGRAVTARILADGVREGASLAFLGASPMGFGIYQRLGFRVAERWASISPADVRLVRYRGPSELSGRGQRLRHGCSRRAWRSRCRRARWRSSR